MPLGFRDDTWTARWEGVNEGARNRTVWAVGVQQSRRLKERGTALTEERHGPRKEVGGREGCSEAGLMGCPWETRSDSENGTTEVHSSSALPGWSQESLAPFPGAVDSHSVPLPPPTPPILAISFVSYRTL